MAKAEELVRTKKLDRLLIPQAKFLISEFRGRKVPVIAMQKLEFDQNQDGEKLFKETPDLDETIRQLTTFIVLTRMADVRFSTIPLNASNKVALHDLSSLFGAGGSGMGIFGRALFGMDKALINCLYTAQQIDVAIKTAADLGVTISFDNVSDELAYHATPEAERKAFLEELATRKPFAFCRSERIKEDRLDTIKKRSGQ